MGGSVAFQLRSRMDAVDLDEALQSEALLDNSEPHWEGPDSIKISCIDGKNERSSSINSISGKSGRSSSMNSVDGKSGRSSSSNTVDTTCPSTHDRESWQPGDSDTTCSTSDVSGAKANARQRQPWASDGGNLSIDIAPPLPKRRSSNKMLKVRAASKGSIKRSKSQCS